MFGFDRWGGGVADCLGALEMGLTKARVAKMLTYRKWIICLCACGTLHVDEAFHHILSRKVSLALPRAATAAQEDIWYLGACSSLAHAARSLASYRMMTRA